MHYQKGKDGINSSCIRGPSTRRVINRKMHQWLKMHLSKEYIDAKLGFVARRYSHISRFHVKKLKKISCNLTLELLPKIEKDILQPSY